MDEPARVVSSVDGPDENATLLGDAVHPDSDSAAERNRHRLTGMKLAIVLSIVIWGGIFYGLWVVLHAMPR